MSSNEFTLDAKPREDVGKGASRRLRRLQGEIPAIIYGAGKDPLSITLRHDDIFHAVEDEAFFSSILEINVAGEKESVIIKDMQRHPAKPLIMHADFLRVRADVELTVNVPLHFKNEDTCAGVKLENGQISHLMNELEVTCLPRNLPEYIEVDMAELHVGDTLHISDLKLPDGVTSVELSHGEENNQAVATVTEIRLQAEAPEEAADAAGDEGADSTDGAEDSSDDEEKSGE